MTPADKAVEFINMLTHTQGKRWAGQPFNLRPWQEEIVRNLFLLRPDGLRKHRRCGIWLPRKNGKTELVAAIALFMLCCDSEKGDVLMAAADVKQASICFQKAVDMVRANDELDSLLEIVPSRNRILNHRTGSRIIVLAAEPTTAHGYDPKCVICDELHCWAHKRSVWEALYTSFGAREDPILITITTAGLYGKTLEFDEFQYACKVRDGVIKDETYLPIIYMAPDDADWKDEQVWHDCNPALEDFRVIEEMRTLAKKAVEMPSLENDFRRLYLNQHTAQVTRWLSMDKWLACHGELPDLAGNRCFGGLDMSTKRDVTACVLVFPLEKGFAVKSMMWIPEESAAAAEERDRVPYMTWHKQGFLEFTSGNRVDQDRIVERILEELDRYSCRSFAVDPWNAEAVIQDLMAEGVPVVEMRQGHKSMNEPSRELEALLEDKLLLLEANECLDWMASNVEVEVGKWGHIRPIKSSETNRVDGITALVMALGQAIVDEDEDSIYNQRGVIQI